MVVAAALQLAVTLKGNIPTGNETAEALTKVSELFTKIAAAKQAAAAARDALPANIRNGTTPCLRKQGEVFAQ